MTALKGSCWPPGTLPRLPAAAVSYHQSNSPARLVLEFLHAAAAQVLQATAVHGSHTQHSSGAQPAHDAASAKPAQLGLGYCRGSSGLLTARLCLYVPCTAALAVPQYLRGRLAKKDLEAESS